MVKADSLTKSYGDFHALKGISFSIEEGEIVGLLGPNGAGKTTLMRIMSGFMPATDGMLKVGGIEVHADPGAVKKLCGYLPERPPLYDNMTVGAYLRFCAELHGLKGHKRNLRANEMMKRVNLSDRAGQLIRSLSKGLRQRTGLAMAMISDPKLLILDEPSAGLDPNQIVDIRKYIRDLSGERTVILSSHIIPEVEATCRRFLILSEGEILAADSGDRLTTVLEGGSAWTIRLAGNADRGAELLGTIPDLQVKAEGKELELICEEEKIPEAVRQLSSAGLDIYEVKPRRHSLEEVFRKLTG